MSFDESRSGGLPYWEDYYPYGTRSAPDTQTEAYPTLTLPAIQEALEKPSEPLAAVVPLHTDPKVLVIDIECSPNLAYVYDVWRFNASPDMLQETGEVISFAYKWLHKTSVNFRSKYHHGKQDMIKKAWNVLDQADIVLTYFGKRYDIPRLNTEFAKMGLTPPQPYKHLDLYNTVKGQFNFTFKGLDFVCKELGLTGKTDKISFSTWLAAMQNDPKAWDIIEAYNKGDVLALEELYYRIRPWIKSHPSFAVFTRQHVCPICGSKKLQRRGYAHSTVNVYQRWQCQQCGAWSRTSKKEDGVEIRQVSDS